MEPDNHAAQSRRYEAAESMLQHARTPRTQQQALNALLLPKTYPTEDNVNDTPHPLNRPSTVPISPYSNFQIPMQPDHLDQAQPYNPILDGRLAAAQDPKPRLDYQGLQAFMRQPTTNVMLTPSQEYRHVAPGSNDIHGASLKSNHLAARSEPTSPSTSRALALKDAGNGKTSNRPPAKKSSKKAVALKEEEEKPPPWSELKTKAGKDRKRLPLACIACRRKKIRCSGEKPACKHCLRSRIPCVYKITMRKAAPRTDYMAMLDKRLKRMEDRVIKILPGDEATDTSTPGRANVRPSTAGSANNAHSGKKRAAAEAFGPDLEEWAQSRSSKQAMASREYSQDQLHTEGLDMLPPQDIQEHLAEVYFDCVYGQSYLLLHKPSFMRLLRARTAPPVLVNSEPAFLRGEQWAAPAREIVLKSYDQPSITILTVLLMLGLHEFGTCQGGRSWMFSGMATRMAYALQLHRELDHDPLLRKDDTDPKLSDTDREIRRRAMWACFLMDRFSSSGTERPTCGAEDYLKIQLPTNEFNFQNELPSPVQTLVNETISSSTSNAERIPKAKDHTCVASYIVQVIVLWGRVIMYLNLGGKEKDPHELWHPDSMFTSLQRQVKNLKASLPSDMQFNADNLAKHASQKLGNQFLFSHIAYHQVTLFLHRHAIPITPGAVMSENMPKAFQSTSAHVAVEAASQISDLVDLASEHNLVAPFAGYCAFTSSTVHIWSMFSNQLPLRASAKRKLEINVNYIRKMKKYWGMFHFMGDNLKEIWKNYRDHALQKGNGVMATSTSDSSLFQYGDWFKRYPNGVAETEYGVPATTVKEESAKEPTLSQQSDLQNVEAVFDKLSPRVRGPSAGHKAMRKGSSKAMAVQTRAHPPQVIPPSVQHEEPVQSMTAMAGQTAIAPSPFSPHPSQPLYSTLPPQTYESMGPSAELGLLPNLDRNMVYNAYVGTSGAPMSSTDASFMPLSMDEPTPSMWGHPMGEMGVHPPQSFGGMGNYMGDQSSAWFMPFNMLPPTGFVGEMDGGGYGVYPMDGNQAAPGMDGASRQ
ncbi:MAG: hypothetical protein Q9168_003704 [Polycauliona sp. 1 TL-2023]